MKITDLPYKIRYKILHHSKIFNYIGPDRPKYVIQKRVERLNERNQFYIKLEDSILKNGFRNPICCQNTRAGFLHNRIEEDNLARAPKYMLEDDNKLLFCDRKGGSRLWIAEKHNLEIPCLICDYCEMFPECEPIEPNQESIQKYFMDQFIGLRFLDTGILIQHLPPIHMFDS